MTAVQNEMMTEISEFLVESRKAFKAGKPSKGTILYGTFERRVSMYHTMLGMTERECKDMAKAMATAYMCA